MIVLVATKTKASVFTCEICETGIYSLIKQPVEILSGIRAVSMRPSATSQRILTLMDLLKYDMTFRLNIKAKLC